MTGHDTNWHDLTGFQRDCLQTLMRLDARDMDRSGQAVRRELEADYDEQINHGRLYPNLDALVERGLIEKGSIDQRTNDYRPTSDARELVRRTVQSWMGVIETEQPLADGGRR